MTSLLMVRNISKEFANVKAVDGVSFQVQRGQIFALPGPNGAGKIFRLGMLMYGKEPSLKEMMHWVRRA